MISSQTRVGALEVVLWEESSKPSYGSQDSSLIAAQPGALRVAVMDGCTPSRRTPSFASMDGAAYAAEMVRACLKTVRTIDEAVRQANAFLFATAPQLRFRSRPLAGYTACDISLETLSVVEASGTGDCEIWARQQSDWTRLYGGRYVTDEALAVLKERNLGVTDLLQHVDIEEELLTEHREFLVNPLVGSFEEAQINPIAIDSWDELVLASGGARLNEERVSRLDDWMSELRKWEIAAAERGELSAVKPFDDVTVIRVRR